MKSKMGPYAAEFLRVLSVTSSQLGEDNTYLFTLTVVRHEFPSGEVSKLWVSKQLFSKTEFLVSKTIIQWDQNHISFFVWGVAPFVFTYSEAPVKCAHSALLRRA